MPEQNVNIQTIENGRAAFAFNAVKEYVDKHSSESDFNSNFKSYIKKMPAMIHVNGLGQTLAFYYSKRTTKAYGAIYKMIGDYLKTKFDSATKYTELIDWVVNLQSPEYRLATNETMALLDWMRKFVSGLVTED
ncbi:MAG: type III-B CRISPR module-associated protein Cmr5 [Sporolactobacillus sp.]|jgi:CRISPR-associated protein Cmr5|nr:type III-B CRISPR module-associated protein Cmr5 [Sporolactobacillus sp.]